MALEIRRSDAFGQPPKAVIFDTDNTLYPYDPSHRAALAAAEEKACKLLGVARERFREAYTEARDAVKRQLGETASSHSRLLYYQRAIERLGMKSQLLMTLDLEQTYWRTFLGASALFPNVKEFVQDLGSAGIATAIITDLTSQIQFRKIIYFGLDGFFDYVVTSEEAGADKPAFAPFRLAIEKLDLPPAEIWMIGDNAAADIDGGRSAGMVTLQKRHAGVAVVDGANGADAVFDDFGDLGRWLKDHADLVATAETI